MHAPEIDYSNLSAAPGSYFSGRGHFSTDVATGVTRDRGGTRVISLNDDFLRGLMTGLHEECGDAAWTVLQRCGEAWGRRLAKRFDAELSQHYGQPLAESNFALVQANLERCFATHGWGRVRLDVSQHERGVLVVEVRRFVLEVARLEDEWEVERLLAGVLGGLFAEFSGQQLGAALLERPAAADEPLRFVITLPERLEGLGEWREAGLKGSELMTRLCESSIA